eukprot:CAMPEP_0115736140 /NCGR_PEP_ID=MMETSP0272-20121206/87095_1 /TAXON_ID=71861 /ORGANISM="Scrippsiella trochoidea, Strain CCMP3099" /LENGTH=149 /DNA_ID=CAMNT_0003180295 /DNA_START=77 /DNA_END=526 /DNA_ORIENTATION=-
MVGPIDVAGSRILKSLAEASGGPCLARRRTGLPLSLQDMPGDQPGALQLLEAALCFSRYALDRRAGDVIWPHRAHLLASAEWHVAGGARPLVRGRAWAHPGVGDCRLQSQPLRGVVRMPHLPAEFRLRGLDQEDPMRPLLPRAVLGRVA